MIEMTRLAMLDQEQAELRQTAVLAGQYYRRLRRSGVPFLLAIALVRDWHGWLWTPMET